MKSLNTTELLGWVFIGLGIASLITMVVANTNLIRLSDPLLWLILAKLYWIQSDMEDFNNETGG